MENQSSSKKKTPKKEVKEPKKPEFSVDRIIKVLLAVRGKKPGKNINLS